MSSLRSIPRSVLFPRLDTIGDLVLLSGLLASLRKAWPHAATTMLVRKDFIGLARLFPPELEWIGVQGAPGKAAPNLEDASALLHSIGGRRWDLVVASTFSSTWAEHLVAVSQRTARRVSIAGWPEPAREFRSLLGALGLPADSPYHKVVRVEERSRETEKYSLLLSELAPEATLEPPRLTLPEDLQSEASRLLALERLEPGHFAAVAPAGTQNVTIKTWPSDRFVEMLVRLESSLSLPALLVGHLSERARLEEIADAARGRGAAPRIFVGATEDLPLLCALIERAALYFGNDSGPMHIASALRIPVAAIFGGGTWPRFQPAGPPSASVIGEMPCFGCGWSCMFEDAPCLRLATVGDGERAVRSALGPRPGQDVVIPASTVLDADAKSIVAGAVRRFGLIESDRAARLEIIKTLDAENRTLRERVAHLDEAERDRAAGLEVIGKLDAEKRMLGRRVARLERFLAAALWPGRLLRRVSLRLGLRGTSENRRGGNG